MENPKRAFATIFSPLSFVFFMHVNAFAQQKPKGPEWKVPANEVSKKSGIAMDENAMKEGKATWNKMCKSCHGAKGLGDGPKAANLEVSSGDFSSGSVQNQSDGSLFYKITKGRDDMPTYAKKLSDEERWQLVAYIRTMKKGGGSTQNTVKEDKEPEKKPTTAKNENASTKKENINKDVKKTPDVMPVNKDSATNNENKAPQEEENKISIYTSPEYLELKKDLDALRKEVDSLNFKLDLILKEKQKK